MAFELHETDWSSDSYYQGEFLGCVFVMFFLMDNVQFMDWPLICIFYCLLGFSLADARETMLINRICLCGKPFTATVKVAEMVLFCLTI